MSIDANTKLDQAIHQAAALAQQLLDILQQEFTGLKERDTDIIQAMSKQKNELLQQMQYNQQITEQLLNQIKPKQMDSDHFLSNHDKDAIQVSWLKYKKLLAEGNRQNQINGQIIAVSKAGVERSLAILRGQQPNSSLYGSTGQFVQLDSGQNTIKA